MITQNPTSQSSRLRTAVCALRSVAAATVLIAATGAGQAPGPVLVSEFIFTSAPFASAHASTIIETPNGILAAWFGGTREGAPDVGIWMARLEAGKWTAPHQIADGVQPDGRRYPCYNPVLTVLPGGTLALFYKVGPQPALWWGMEKTSRDNGRTWSESVRLPDGIIGPVRNKPVQIADGTIVSPSSTESPAEPSVWRMHFELSSDSARTWRIVRPAPAREGPEPDAIQPAILVHSRNVLQALGRSRSGAIVESWSWDAGRTWAPLALTKLPNPNSGIDAITLRNGRYLVVYNHSTSGRSPLNVAISRDGLNWEAVAVLESEPGEYSYPSVMQSADGLVHVTWTWRRERIKHAVLNLSRVQTQPIVNGVWPAGVR